MLVVTHEHWDHVSGFSTASEIFKDFSRWRSLDGVDRKPGRAAGRAARQIQGPGAGGTSARQPQARRRARSSACICRAFATGCRRSSASSSAPRATRCGQRAMRPRRLAKGKTPVYLGPDSAADLDRRIARPAHLCARPAARQEAAAARGAGRRDVSAGGARRLAARARAECRPRRQTPAAFGAPADDYSAPFDRKSGNRPCRRARRRRRTATSAASSGITTPARLHRRTSAREETRQQACRRKPHRSVVAAHRCGLAGHRRRSRHAARSRRQQHQPGARLRVHRQRPRAAVPGRCAGRQLAELAKGQMARRDEGGRGDRPAGADRLSQGRASRQPERDARSSMGSS